MAHFSEARARVPDSIPVVNVEAPGVKDVATVTAIEAFGEMGGKIRKEFISDELREDLQEASLMVNALNDPSTKVRPDGTVDISGSAVEGIFSETDKSFQRLARQRVQGKINRNQVALEAERILRESVAKAPGFEPELRRIAAEAVGFDVTGAATRTFFGLGEAGGPSGGKTELEKMADKANALSSIIPGLSFNKAIEAIARAEFIEINKTITDQKLLDNNIDGVSYGQEQAANFEADALFTIQQAVGPDGVVSDPDSLNFELRRLHNSYRNRALKATNKNGLIDAKTRTDVEEILNNSLEAVLAMAGDRDGIRILAANADAVVDANVIAGAVMFPGYMAVKTALGPEFLQSMINMMAIAENNPAKIAELRRANPGFDAAYNVMRTADRGKLGDMILNIVNRTGDRSAFNLDELKALSQLLVEDGFGSGNKKAVDGGVRTMLEEGMNKKPLSQVARRKCGYAMLSNETKQLLLNSYQGEVIQTMNDLSNKMREEGLSLRINDTTKRFEFMRGGLPLNLSQPRFFGGPGGNVGAQADLNYANEVLLAMQMNNPDFLKDAGIDDHDTWKQLFVQGANEGAALLPEEPEALRGPEGQDLTRIEPGVFQDEQGNIFQVGEDGGFNQIGGAVQREEEVKTFVPVSAREPEFPERASTIVGQIKQAAEANDIDPRLMVAIAKVESSFNPKAKNPKSSATGLFQNTDANFADFGPEGGDRTNPEDSIAAAVEFIKFLEGRTEDLDELLIRWHDGQNSVGASPEALNFARKVKRELGLI